NRVDVLCNNAGIGHFGYSKDMSLERWRDVIETNLLGPVHGIVSFLPHLLTQPGTCHIVNIASVAGLIGLPGLAGYCARKFGVVGMTEALSVELPPEKIRLSVICPGVIKTNIVQDGHFTPMGKLDQGSALAFYDRFGANPEQVAADVIRAVERRSF